MSTCTLYELQLDDYFGCSEKQHKTPISVWNLCITASQNNLTIYGYHIFTVLQFCSLKIVACVLKGRVLLESMCVRCAAVSHLLSQSSLHTHSADDAATATCTDNTAPLNCVQAR